LTLNRFVRRESDSAGKSIRSFKGTESAPELWDKRFAKTQDVLRKLAMETRKGTNPNNARQLANKHRGSSFRSIEHL
jgi:hypothetical protein